MSGYREELRGEWLGYPVGLGYTLQDGKFTLYMIQQEEQAVIKIVNEKETKLFKYIPIPQIDEETAKWLMDETKSKLKVFNGIEQYEQYEQEKYK